MSRRIGLLALLGVLAARPAAALDKQGSAHGGGVEGDESGFGVYATVMTGLSLYNPSYAARPDNTGLALARYAAHVDVDLIGRRLSIPIDVNMFTDREREGVAKLAPTELDFITGLTSTWDTGSGAVEVGARVEQDRPVDREGRSQTYGDLRTRYLFSASALSPAIADALARALRGGDVSGTATLGWFAYNKSYFARPDNSGIALFRYAARGEVSAFERRVGFAVDGTMFTDKHAAPFRPSELDLTVEIIGRVAATEVHLAYERDMTIDGLGTNPGFVQQFVYLLLAWSFGS